MSESDEAALSLPELVAAVLESLREDDGGVEPLGRICRACTQLLPVDGASISVMVDAGRRLTLYASDPTILQVEDIQFGLGEGPCFEAFNTGRPVLVPDLVKQGSTVWPVFATEAAGHPIGAIFAFPLQRGAARFGAMDMYRRTPGWLSDRDLAVALHIVDIATSALLAASSGDPNEVISTAWVADIARNRVAVHQATGMIVAEFGIPADQALSLLRAHAYSQGRQLDDVSADIVAGRLHPGVIGT